MDERFVKWARESVEEREKTADRPHRITIVSNFIGPLIAVATIFMSVWLSNRAKRISDNGTRRAQRGYVVVRNTHCTRQRRWYNHDTNTTTETVRCTFVASNS